MTTKLSPAKSLISREARHLIPGQQTKKEHRRKLHNPPKNRAGLRASPYRPSREIFFPARTLQGSYWFPRVSTRDSHWAIADLTFPSGCSFPPLATTLRFTSRFPVSTNRPVRDFSPIQRFPNRLYEARPFAVTRRPVISGGLPHIPR